MTKHVACSPKQQRNVDLHYYRDSRSLTWADHWVYQLDGNGGRVARRAQFRFLPPYDDDRMVFPWGLATMDNGEIALAGVACNLPSIAQAQTVLAFTKDRGATWSKYVPVEGCSSRPMMLAYLGNGVLSFMSSWEKTGSYRLYSHDYGRTWTERVKLPTAPDGQEIACEGNSLVDRDADGVATRIAETGQTRSKGPFPENPCCGCIRWSSDGGRTSDRFDWPKEWIWQDTHEGKVYERGVGEGAVVRAADGSIVAALRTDMPVWLLPLYYDNFQGTAVSVSRDEGKTWSPLKRVLGLGWHHANLVRLPNDDLVMTVIRRLHLQEDGRLASYRRGCDAVVSRDNGRTWDVDHMYVLDEFSSAGTAEQWYSVACGHLFSVALDDGSVLTTYGNYKNAGALILWKP